jgi:hypothetical protein
MAVNYKDIVSKLENDPLTSNELLLIQEAEEHIDSVIKEKFGIRYYETQIDECIVRFDYSPKNKKHIDIKQPRRNVMQRELIKRYSDAGWEVKFDTDTDSSYVTFKGKK